MPISDGESLSPNEIKAHPILYVDDEEPNLVVFEVAFEEVFTIRTASSAEEAIDLMQRERISILVADQKMPRMSGVELCSQTADQFPHVRRVILTAYADKRTAIEAINRGRVHHFINKPWEVNELRHLLLDLVTRAHLENANRTLRAAILERERAATAHLARRGILHDISGTCCALSATYANLRTAGEELEIGTDPPALSLLKMREELSSLERAIAHISSLVDKARRMNHSKCESRRPLPLNDVIVAVVGLAQRDLPNHAIVNHECPADLWVLADYVDLCRILLNLLQNASNALRESGPRHDAGRVHVKAVAKGRHVMLRISDNGPGVPPELGDHVFDMFCSTRHHVGGQGIGLGVSRDLAKANGGSLSLGPPEGPGATFELKLLRTAPAAPQARAARATMSQARRITR